MSHTQTPRSPHPGPELLIQSAGDQAALEEDSNPVVVADNSSILWCFLRLCCDLRPLCGRLVWI